MKKFLLLSFICFTINLNVNKCLAQVASYQFTDTILPYTSLAAPVVLGNGAVTGQVYRQIPIGFNFYFNGEIYNVFNVCVEGYIALGTNQVGPITPISALSQTISIFGANLSGHSNAQLAYELTGTAPNRIMSVEWQNFKRSTGTGNSLDTLTGKILLLETNNTVQMHYNKVKRGLGVFSSANTGFQVGIKGGSPADFLSRKATNNANNWQNSTLSTLNTDALIFSDTVLVPNGLQYQFSPDLPPTAPINISFTTITPNSMVLNFVDNSTTERSFIILRSTDNINFFREANILSTSVSTTATNYIYTANGLISGTTYYWKILAVANVPGTSLDGTQATLAGTMCGTYTVGPTGNYSAINQALQFIKLNGLSCPIILELQSTYNAVEPLLTFNSLGNSPSNTITIRPALGATNLNITNTIRALEFNNVQNIIFDGRPGGLGTTSELTITTTSTTFNTILFTNNAKNVQLNYLKIKGSNATVSNGVVFLGSGSNGIDDITIDHCIFSEVGTNTPTNFIYSNSVQSLDAKSENIVISNNEFKNWFNAAASTSAIICNNMAENWSILNNHFYQTTPRTYTANSIHYAIFINALYAGFTINNNSIGGSGINNSGGATQLSGLVDLQYVPINVNTSINNELSVKSNYVYGNKIGNIQLNSAATISGSPGVFTGIYGFGAGELKIGDTLITTDANIIGDTNSNNSIIINCGNGGATFGIVSASDRANVILNNVIAGVQVAGTNNSLSANFTGIVTNLGTSTISNNIIGSNLPNSIELGNSTNTTSANLVGISASGNTTSAQGYIEQNTIRNLNNLYTGSANNALARGISIINGTFKILNNKIYSIKNSTLQSLDFGQSAVQGINYNAIASTNFLHEIFDNKIYDLTATTSSTNKVNVIGINFNNSSTKIGNIYRNNIYGLSIPNNNDSVQVKGINIAGGKTLVYNNFISLGLDALGNSIGTPNIFKGLVRSSNLKSLFYHNSVLITGTNTAASSINNSMAYACDQIVAPYINGDSVYNNILANTRINSNAINGKNIAFALLNNVPVIFNNNCYKSDSLNFAKKTLPTPVNYNTLNDWQTASNQDKKSIIHVPTFINPTDNLHINNVLPSPLESKANSIISPTNDIDNDNRPGPFGSINGGGLFADIGADEFDGIVTNNISIEGFKNLPNNICYTVNNPIAVKIKNIGVQILDFSITPISVQVTQSLNSAAAVVIGALIITTGTLSPDSTLETTVIASYPLVSGISILTANAGIINDDNLTNNTYIDTVNVFASPTILATALTTNAIAAANSTFLNQINLSGASSYDISTISSPNISSLLFNGIYTGSSVNANFTTNNTISVGNNILYTIIGTDINGCKDTVQLTVNIDIITSLNKLSNNNTLLLMPNPVSNILIIENNLPLCYSVWDINGKMLWENSIPLLKQELNMSGLKNGLYIIKVISNNSISTHKISVVH